jgi:outer membrane protein assembly factor BamB
LTASPLEFLIGQADAREIAAVRQQTDLALRAGTGRIAWTHSLERGVVASNFALAGGVLFLTAYDGSRGDHFLVTLDAASGAMIAQSSRSRLTGRSAALAVTQGKVRLLTDSSYLSGIGLPD